MQIIEQSIGIKSPIGMVWSILIDWESRTKWAPRVEKAKIVGKDTLRKGTRIKMQVDGRKFTPKVTAFEPQELLTVKVGSYAVNVKHSYRLMSDNEDTILTISIQYGGIFGSIVGSKSLTSSNMELDEELSDLKKIIEDSKLSV